MFTLIIQLFHVHVLNCSEVWSFINTQWNKCFGYVCMYVCRDEKEKCRKVKEINRTAICPVKDLSPSEIQLLEGKGDTVTLRERWAAQK